VWCSMYRSTDPDTPRQRKPGAGRKPGSSEPVTIVSISMDPSTLRQIDREATRAGRTRSAFVRYLVRRGVLEIIEKRERATPNLPPLEDPTHGGRFDPALADGREWLCPTPPCGGAPSLSGGWLYCPRCGVERPEES